MESKSNTKGVEQLNSKESTTQEPKVHNGRSNSSLPHSAITTSCDKSNFMERKCLSNSTNGCTITKDEVLANYDVDDDDEDVIVLEIQNDCENLALSPSKKSSVDNDIGPNKQTHNKQGLFKDSNTTIIDTEHGCNLPKNVLKLKSSSEANQTNESQKSQNNQTIVQHVSQDEMPAQVLDPNAKAQSKNSQGIYDFHHLNNNNNRSAMCTSSTKPLDIFPAESSNSSSQIASLASITINPSPCLASHNVNVNVSVNVNNSSVNDYRECVTKNSKSNSLKSRQLTFLKSQSLDLHNEESLSTSNNINQNLFFNQLPEISELLSLEVQQEERGTEDSPIHKNLGSISKPYTGSVDTYISLGYNENIKEDDEKSAEAAKLQSLESRPIYPNVPFSPYASPYGSPRTHRRPLRESRRISIERSGSFLQLNQYKLMDQIGQGSYGLVKLAYSEEDSTHYAMKILSKGRLLRQAGLMCRGPKKRTSPLDRVYREIAVLKKLDHPNVVKLVEVLDDPVEDSLYMVFELVRQGEVLSIPTDKPLPEERAWSVFRETLLGLEYLHYQRIIHADIKPGNLLLTECGHVKIADLGVCNEFLGEDATMNNGSTAGTPAFRAPETLILGQNVYCGRAADIWALGATLYSLVFGNVPFLAKSIPLLYEKIQNENLSFPSKPNISTELKECIEAMLTKDASKRITLPQLKENNWVTAFGKSPLPTEDENCRLVQVSDEDINSVVRSIPKLDTLILIKTMLKKHSFGNPFAKGISGRAPQRGGSRLERFIRAGRSNSAPGSYHLTIDRQPSGDNMLPALSELVPNSHEET